jgi:Domain of unknown function (DUF4440)
MPDLLWAFFCIPWNCAELYNDPAQLSYLFPFLSAYNACRAGATSFKLLLDDANRLQWQSTAASKPQVLDTRKGANTCIGTNAEQELLNLFQEKWRWMSERNVDSLAALFHEQSVFVHMGGTMSKAQELDVIKSEGIHYKHVDIQEASVRFIGTTTAILLSNIRLVAAVGGNEVTNPFVVTEVYVQQNGAWTLASLSFTRLLTP